MFLLPGSHLMIDNKVFQESLNILLCCRMIWYVPEYPLICRPKCCQNVPKNGVENCGDSLGAGFQNSRVDLLSGWGWVLSSAGKQVHFSSYKSLFLPYCKYI